MNVVLDLIREYGVMVIFLAIMLEYACFPLPSEVLLPLSGVLCAKIGIPWAVIYGFSIIAGIIGSSLCYGVGFWGGQRLIQKAQARWPKTQKGLDKGQALFERYAQGAVLVCRMIPLCRTYISFIAGAGRQRYGSFLLFSAVGIAIWNALLLSAGYALGDNWLQIVLYYQWFKNGLLLLAAAATLLLLARHFGKKHVIRIGKR